MFEGFRSRSWFAARSTRQVVLEAHPSSPGAFSRLDSLAILHLSVVSVDLSQVGRDQQHRDEYPLSGDAAHAAPSGLGQRLVGRVFREPVPSLDGVAQRRVETRPLL